MPKNKSIIKTESNKKIPEGGKGVILANFNGVCTRFSYIQDTMAVDN